MADSKISKPNDILVCQHQFYVNPSITVPENNTATIFSNADLFSLSFQTLDPLPSGRTLIGASFLWANTALCLCNDLLVSNGKITITLRNPTTISATITNIRILAFWK